jgi:hypothetical protein
LKILDHRCLWVWAQLKLSLLSVLFIVFMYFTYSHFQILKYLKIFLFEHLQKIHVFRMSLLWFFWWMCLHLGRDFISDFFWFKISHCGKNIYIFKTYLFPYFSSKLLEIMNSYKCVEKIKNSTYVCKAFSIYLLLI